MQCVPGKVPAVLARGKHPETPWLSFKLLMWTIAINSTHLDSGADFDSLRLIQFSALGKKIRSLGLVLGVWGK